MSTEQELSRWVISVEEFDAELRRHALELAIEYRPQDAASTIVQTAEKFYTFLKGQ